MLQDQLAHQSTWPFIQLRNMLKQVKPITVTSLELNLNTQQRYRLNSFGIEETAADSARLLAWIRSFAAIVVFLPNNWRYIKYETCTFCVAMLVCRNM